MADLKISQLSDGGNSQATDEYVIARSGANYRIDGASVAAAATSVGTLTSLTVSGNLTVDTNTLYVDAANNRVGVGTASPGFTLDIEKASGSGRQDIIRVLAGPSATNNGASLTLGSTQTRAAYITGLQTASTSGALVFGVESSGAYSEVGRFDSSGNLGIGVTPTARLHVSNATGGTTAANYVNIAGSTANNSNYPGIQLTGGTLATTYPMITLSNGGLALQLTKGFSTGNPGKADVILNDPGIIVFNTASTGTATERARITATGEFFGVSAGSFGIKQGVTGGAGTTVGLFVGCHTATAGNPSSGTDTIIIWSNGNVVNTNGSYGTISDIKHKQDVVDAPSQWDDLKAVRFRKFRIKSDVAANPDAPYLLGVVAQELEQVSPGLIDEHPDYEDCEVEGDDGTVTTEKVQIGTTKSVKSSVLLMKAAVALQEAMARIEALEARLDALKA